MSPQRQLVTVLAAVFCTISVGLSGSLAQAADTEEPLVALVGATVHPVSSEPIESGVVVMRGSKIAAVGAGDLVPAEATTVDVSGKHVYPSLIAAYSQLGLVEVESVRPTRDLRETGSINPNATAYKAFNPDSELIPPTRSNGVLLALSVPVGGRISGTASLMRLAGWTWEDMTVEPRVGIYVNWPRVRERPHDHDEEDKSKSDKKSPVDQLEELFDQASRYSAERSGANAPRGVDLRLDALAGVVSGELPLIVGANGQAEIEQAVAFAVERDLKIIVHGGYDAPRCAALLVEHNVPVILEGVKKLPWRRHEPYDHAFTLPARLHEAGVTFCIAASGNGTSWNARNLPYHAAMANAFGLPREVALRSITLDAARVLGVDDRVGSLEPGKHATLVVTDGDPLETTTKVERAFVMGEEIDLDDRQKQLYRKFRRRLE